MLEPCAVLTVVVTLVVVLCSMVSASRADDWTGWR